ARPVTTAAPKKSKLTPICTHEDEDGEQPYGAPEKLPKTGNNPADIPKDSSEAKEDPHVANWEQIYLHEEHEIDSLAKLSPDEARKIETEDLRDKSPLPQSPVCASQKRTFSMTHSDGEMTGYDFSHNPAPSNWIGAEQEDGPDGCYDPGPPRVF
ncbi:hypothetical protein LQW54_012001, partial [Pestalotiopsis sp. IQ-011]